MSAGLEVVVVTHNAKPQVLASLDALRADPAHDEWDVIVVDNASVDASSAAIAERHPWVRVLRNDVGRGYAGALNQAIAASGAEHIALMTAGTIVPAGGLARLSGALDEDPGIAAAGPLIRHPDGRVQRHGLFRPSPLTAFVVLSGLGSVGPFRREAERYYGPHEPGPSFDVDQLTGACLVLRREAFDDVGPFDAERFFLYCEDVDWSLRARYRGWRLRSVPSVEVTRPKSTTSAGASAATIRMYYRSLRAFYAKHSSRTDPAPLRPLLYAAAYAKETLALLANALRREKGLRY